MTERPASSSDVSSSPAAQAAHTSRARQALRLLTGQRLRGVWITAAILFALFSASRMMLLVFKRDLVAGASGAEIRQCLLLGLRYDAMPVGYAMLPMVAVLTLVAGQKLLRRRLRGAVAIYAAFITIFVLFIEVGGVFFFCHYGRRLNWMTFGYAHWETLEFLWKNYPVWATLPVLGGGAYLLYRLYQRWFWRGAVVCWPLPLRLGVAAAFVGLCVLACRGGLQSHPLNSGSAYFSVNQVINRLAMNDFYTMFDAAHCDLTDGRDEQVRYNLPLPDEAGPVVAAMFRQEGDTPLPSHANPLWRRSVSPNVRRDYNVVVILMESMAGGPVGALGVNLEPSQTPNLDALADESLFFERMYATGARTSRGLTAVLCGHPDLRGRTVLKRPQAQGRFLTLPSLLQQRGYQTMFIYGGRSEFDNMGPFFAAGGIEEIIDQDQMPGVPGNWGVPDETIFQVAHERFLAAGDRKFFAAILTVSNHEPFEVPAGRVEMLPTDLHERNRVLNAYRYADWALGEFFRLARSAPYYQRTVFVLVADHGREVNQERAVDVPGFRVPCLFHAPGIIPPGRVDTVASQTDIAPTLLGWLGGDYAHCFFGRDLMRVRPDGGFALLHEDTDLAFVRGRTALTVTAGPRTTWFEIHPADMKPLPAGQVQADLAEIMWKDLRSYYAMAKHLHDVGAYCDPSRAAVAQSPGAPHWR